MRHIRILRIAGLHYRTPMTALYANHPGLETRSYAEQQQTLFQDAYVYSDSFARGMRSLGHDAREIVYDLEPLQKSWAQENGQRFDPRRWQTDIVLRQIAHYRPEVVFLQDIHCLPHTLRRDLKRQFPFVRLVVVHKGFPGAATELGDVDILLAGIPSMVAEYRRTGLRPHLLYHAFDETVLDKLGTTQVPTTAPRHGLTFVGSSGFAQGLGHQARYWTLFTLFQEANLEAWIEDQSDPKHRLSTKVRLRRGLQQALRQLPHLALNWLGGCSILPSKLRRAIQEVIAEQAPVDGCSRPPPRPMAKVFPQRCHPPVFGLEMYRVLAESSISFNMHTDAAQGCVGNLRMFQATGAGSCLLTDDGTNCADLFERDREIVTYSTVTECLEKVRYLRDHEAARRQIAAAGQRRTLRAHTVRERCRQIDELIQAALRERS